MSEVFVPIKRVAHLLSPRFLELILLPTEACNFRCVYCYENFSIGRMKPDVIAAVKALLDRRVPDLDELSLSWFGGEPLAAPKTVLDISAHAAALAAARPGFRYSAAATTNGYLLTPRLLAELVTVGVTKFQISLDGPRGTHDQSRVRADGKGTFDRIWSNLLSIRDGSAPVQVILRIHLTRTSLPEMDILIEDIRREFLPDPRFKVFLKPVERLGGPNDGALDLLEGGESEVAIRSLERKLYGDDYVRPDEGPHVCYAARPNSLMIRADGGIGKCTVALYDPRNQIGHIKPDGKLDLDTARLTPWMRGWSTAEASALECPLYGLPSPDEEVTIENLGPVGQHDAALS